jgi:hypothetical protein
MEYTTTAHRVAQRVGSLGFANFVNKVRSQRRQNTKRHRLGGGGGSAARCLTADEHS